jgi:hypothetical protein
MEIQHTYRIRHKGLESSPHSVADLRQMLKAGAIDSTTEFKRADSTVWLDANDLWAELHLDEPQFAGKQSSGAPSLHIGSTRPGASREIVPTAPVPVRVVSVRLPFREVFALTFKFFAAAVLVAVLGAAAWLVAGRSLP